MREERTGEEGKVHEDEKQKGTYIYEREGHKARWNNKREKREKRTIVNLNKR